MHKSVFLKFYVINTLDNLPFQPYYSIPHAISFQKMHIIWAVQFSPKKSSSCELCTACLFHSATVPEIAAISWNLVKIAIFNKVLAIVNLEMI